MTVGVPGTAPEERALAEPARAEADAFAALYREHVRRVYAFVYRRTGSTVIAEDITAATFEHALRGLASFDGRPGGLAPWLLRIAANEITDHYRRRTRAESSRALAAAHRLQADADHGGYDEVDDRVDTPAARLREALGRLHPRYQQALSLRYLAGLSLGEVAAAMQCTKPVASVTVHRATAALRRAMDVSTREERS